MSNANNDRIGLLNAYKDRLKHLDKCAKVLMDERIQLQINIRKLQRKKLKEKLKPSARKY